MFKIKNYLNGKKKFKKNGKYSLGNFKKIKNFCFHKNF